MFFFQAFQISKRVLPQFGVFNLVFRCFLVFHSLFAILYIQNADFTPFFGEHLVQFFLYIQNQYFADLKQTF